VLILDSLENGFLDAGNSFLDSVGHGGGSLGLWATKKTAQPAFKFYFLSIFLLRFLLGTADRGRFLLVGYVNHGIVLHVLVLVGVRESKERYDVILLEQLLNDVQHDRFFDVGDRIYQAKFHHINAKVCHLVIGAILLEHIEYLHCIRKNTASQDGVLEVGKDDSF